VPACDPHLTREVRWVLVNASSTRIAGGNISNPQLNNLMKLPSLASRSSLLLTALAAFAFTQFSPVQAADEKAAPVAGTYSWTSPGRNGGPERKSTLKIKQEGDKITGNISSPGRDGAAVETPIADAKLTGSDLTFKVTREFNGNKFVSSYTGKVTAESIKGKMEFERNGEKSSRDWEAKREAEKK